MEQRTHIALQKEKVNHHGLEEDANDERTWIDPRVGEEDGEIAASGGWSVVKR